MRRPRAGRALGAALAGAWLALAGCALVGGEEGAPGEEAEEGAGEDAGWSPVPVGRSRHPVGGRLSYHLASVTRRGDEVLVDLDLRNGTSRLYATTAVEVTVLGGDGQSRTRWLPIGVLGSQRKKRVVARIPEVPFEVVEVLVEVYAR